ncbi:hypothetical protein MJO28_002109 [Puccinia striiformis f. sp. tritici]|uniref:tRNA (guanine(9)-N1)-methyltransferase n=2 Tax=Puccinia striiformis f. sp. tritici TaxID=168172 RepID=A0A0L0W349_9BASI|nr:hypothetical protein MJO28_002109 [Puccinia striiformis f. sp. tritici]KNF05931.1 hypothetical protein PSTG_00924 [Puccinia striiformis f. sp. tritici PST-78]
MEESKNQKKRKIRRQAILEERPAKRAAERARKKAKKLNNTETTTTTIKHAATTVFPATVVLDCRFDDKMSEKEIVSLDRQIAHSYSINRKSRVQFQSLVCTSFNGKLKDRLDKNGQQYLRWKSVKFIEESIEGLIDNRTDDETQQSKPEPEGNDDDGDGSGDEENEEDLSMDDKLVQASLHSTPLLSPINKEKSTPVEVLQPNSEPQQSGTSKQSSSSSAGIFDKEILDNRENIIYLTADSSNVLTTLDPNKVYVIGAIVDHNRYKNLCLDLAEQNHFNHAQLPINQYFSKLKTRKVLTVNQVFEILVEFLCVNDWGKSFDKVIPSRKL